MRKVVFLIAVVLGTCPTGAADVPSTMPTTRPRKEKAVPLRQVEVRLLGKTTDLKGMQWPADPDGRQMSTGVDEPCDLTVRLPSGKMLNLKTRPILIVRRAFEENTVVTVVVPPFEAEPKWLGDQAQLMEKLLADWHAVPNDRMRALIEEFKRIPRPKRGDVVPYAGIERVGGAALDDRSELSFELVLGPGGKWNMVAVISAGQKDRDRIFREGQSRMAASTQSTTRPRIQP